MHSLLLYIQETTANPVVTSVSTATLDFESCSSMESKIASEI